MVHFKNTLAAWNTDNFSTIFKQEVAGLDLDDLPLQQALQFGSYATKDGVQITMNSTIENKDCIIINCGIFYSSIIAGCNCSDDPTPVDLNSEYCEMQFSINKSNAETVISIIS